MPCPSMWSCQRPAPRVNSTTTSQARRVMGHANYRGIRHCLATGRPDDRRGGCRRLYRFRELDRSQLRFQRPGGLRSTNSACRIRPASRSTTSLGQTQPLPRRAGLGPGNHARRRMGSRHGTRCQYRPGRSVPQLAARSAHAANYGGRPCSVRRSSRRAGATISNTNQTAQEQELNAPYYAPALAANPNVTFLAATGDGSAAYGPIYPSISPLTVAVGGTTLQINGTTWDAASPSGAAAAAVPATPLRCRPTSRPCRPTVTVH